METFGSPQRTCETFGVKWASSEDLADHFVRPWYLHTMRTNACQYAGDLAPEIGRVALDADDDILVRLLRLGWRDRVIGEIGCRVTRDSEKVTSEVLHQLEGSHGSLDAPPIAAAAVTPVGPAAMASLAIYHQADVAEQWGAADINPRGSPVRGGTVRSIESPPSPGGRLPLDFRHPPRGGRGHQE